MSTAASYDAAGQQHRSFKSTVHRHARSLINMFVFVALLRFVVAPYLRMYADRCVEYEKAETYSQSPNCVVPSLRSKLEGYNKCNDARLLLDQRMWLVAMFDWADSFSLCSMGMCFLGELNVTNLLGILVVLGVACIVLFLVYNIVSVIAARHASIQAAYQMPFTAPTPYHHQHAQVPVGGDYGAADDDQFIKITPYEHSKKFV